MGGAGELSVGEQPRLTRRTVLAGALVAVAGCRKGRTGQTVGTRPAPAPAATLPSETTGTLTSRNMSGSPAWTIVTPAGRPPAGVVFCLHAIGGNNRMAFDDIRLPEVAAALGIPLAFAAIDGGAD